MTKTTQTLIDNRRAQAAALADGDAPLILREAADRAMTRTDAELERRAAAGDRLAASALREWREPSTPCLGWVDDAEARWEGDGGAAGTE